MFLRCARSLSKSSASQRIKPSQYDVGEPFLIEPDDQSPFQKFGFVHKGQVVQALYNNLIRVPIFRQKAYHTDFLVVRCVFLLEAEFFCL